MNVVTWAPPTRRYVQSAGRLRDCASAVRSEIYPSCLVSQSLNVMPPMTPVWSLRSDAGVTRPACSAAPYVYTLNDDPTPRQPSGSTPVRLIWPRIAAVFTPRRAQMATPDLTHLSASACVVRSSVV